MLFVGQFKHCSAIIVFVLLLNRQHNIALVITASEDDWNYWGPMGEHRWDKHYKDCRGRQQSPVNVETERLVVVPDLQLTFINYDRPMPSMRIIHSVHGIKLAPTKTTDSTFTCFVTGSAFNSQMYRFLQLHFHWRNAHSKGSEHAIDGQKFTMEMHMVHQNVKYDTDHSVKINKAEDAFTVLAVFFNETETHNPALDPIVNYLDSDSKLRSSVELNDTIQLDTLLPTEQDVFYKYSGSYTTPACYEIVTWIIFPEVLHIGVKQMQKFRNILTTIVHNKTMKAKLQIKDNDELIGYYRHIQELGTRRIYASRIYSSIATSVWASSVWASTIHRITLALIFMAVIQLH